MKICYVCTGNINRSPAAEFIMRHIWPSAEVVSGALSPKAGGQLIAPHMRVALEAAGIPFDTERRSQSLTGDMVACADLVLYMSPVHLRGLMQSWPEHVAKYKGASPWGNVRDPHFSKGTKEHNAVIQELIMAAAWWRRKLEGKCAE